MPNVDITIGRRSFQLVCGEGQEAHLKSLATEVSKRVEDLAVSMGSSNDTLLLVMSALMMQDQLNNKAGQKTESANAVLSSVSESDNEASINLAVAEAVDAIAQYVENVADRIKTG